MPSACHPFATQQKATPAVTLTGQAPKAKVPGRKVPNKEQAKPFIFF
jgi:hypothetical protein